MTHGTKRRIFRSTRSASLYIVVIGVAMALVFPMFFLFSFSLMSDYESYSEWPKPLIPSRTVTLRVAPLDPTAGASAYGLEIYNHSEEAFKPFGPEYSTTDDESTEKPQPLHQKLRQLRDRRGGAAGAHASQ